LRRHNILSLGKDVLRELNEAMTNNEEIKKHLIEAGGLIGLIGIGIKVCEDIHERSLSPGEKAYASLLKYILKSTRDAISDNEDLKGKNSFGRDELMQILKPFEKASDISSSPNWDSNLLSHPVIDSLRSKFEVYLINKGYDKAIISSFIRRFNSEIENKAKDDNDIKKFREWWAIQQQNRDLVLYLEHIESMKNYSSNLDNKPLYAYYVEHNAAWVDLSTWNWPENRVVERYSNNIKSIKQVIHEYLISQDDRWYLIVGASFGTGKTSMVRMIASEYASICLDKGYNNQIPVVVFLKDEDLRVEYKQYSLDNILQFIVAPVNNQESRNRKILLILDGLDEYNKDGTKLLIHKLDELRDKYPNVKAIITTRLEDKVLDDQKIKSDKYVRLLTFTNDQVDEFFKNYGVVVKEAPLTYDHASQLNLPVEEMNKPLFAWIFSYLQMHTGPQLKIESKSHWTKKMIESWIYLLFFHHTIEGKYKDSADNRWRNLYLNEKKTLRRIAALKQIYGEKLTWERLAEELRKFTSANSIADLQPTHVSYFFYLRTTIKGKILDFVHNTFKEYLLAEYYLESLLENKIHRLNTRTPSKETIVFFDGLIDILLEVGDDAVEKYIDQDEISLLKSFDYYEGLSSAIRKLRETASKSFEEENIIFFDTNSNPKRDEETENIWKYVNISGTDYKYSWIHKWILLYTLKKLKPDEEPNKEKLEQLVIYSSNVVPHYLKNLRGIDLSYTELSGAKLSNTWLTNSNLEHANLLGANLSAAELSGANLRAARLVGANLFGAWLFNADLTYANLWNAILSAAKLSGANLSSTNLSGANFEAADLSSSNLSYANLSDAKLSGANLSAVTMSRVILTDANLSHCIILGCTDYHRVVCNDANFTDAIIDNNEMVEYLKNKNARNVPNAVTDKIKLREILVDLYANENTADEILKFSILS
jgi:uncharacterized protein YjbI with pentapeptide repeats